MADTAFQTQYRQEFIAAFEQRQSLLRESVTTESVIKGNTATFLVAGSGGATAVTRGVNGLIPARADDLTQASATLEEWHDLVRKTNFNVFASQGNQKQIMQLTTMAVLNRKIDSQVLAQLAAGTIQTANGATGVQASMGLVTNAMTKLGNAGVPFDGNVWAVVTPAFMGTLIQLKEFSSAEYVSRRPTDGSNPLWKDMAGFYWWNNVKWITHPNLTGVGTSTASCFMYHSSAIGHAVDVAGLETPVGYDEEQAYSWARASGNMGSKLLQNTGVIEMVHDDSVLST